MLETAGFNQLRKARYGYTLYNKNDQYIGKAIENYGEFSESEAILFKSLVQKSDIVIEVGANIGTHTLVFSEIVGERGRVFCFEPQRVIFQTLCANLALNSVTNVEAFWMASGKEEGFLTIPDLDYNLDFNYGGISVDQFPNGSKVRIAKLDDVIQVGRVKLIKIDVEGMEQEVLEGATRLISQCRPILYVENDRVAKSESLLHTIDSMGYTMYWHLPLLYNPNNFDGNLENLYPGIMSINVLCIPKEIPNELQEPAFIKITDFTKHVLDR